MKIKSVEIYGYGQFVQRKVEFDQYFTEIFGQNEAGKSTLQAFIHSILFGFPTKKENEPRLEPRMGNHYGGRVTLILDDGMEVDVERVKGSAQGDVKVYMPNGTIKDEAWLKAQLNYINKKTYQAIFSFNVLGLQDIHKHMSEVQLQNFLMQAGALGSTEFIGMRELINQKKQALYKKSGQNPEINRKIEEVRNLEYQIREESTKIESYQRLTEEHEKASRRLDTLKQNLNQLTGLFEEKQKEVALIDQVQEWKGLEADLNIEPLEFPEKGIDRYETAKIQVDHLERDIGLRVEKQQQLQHENEQLYVPEQTLYQNFEAIAKQEDRVKQQEMELKQTEREFSQHDMEIESLKSHIGWENCHDDVDSSEAQKSYASETLKQKQAHLHTLQQLKKTQDDYQIETVSFEEELQHLNSQLVDDENFEKKKVYDQRLLELKEKRNLFDKMKASFEQETEQKQQQQRRVRGASLILAIVSIAFAIWMFVTNAMVAGVVLTVMAIVFIIGMTLFRSKPVGYDTQFSEELAQLEQEVAQLEAEYDLDFDLSTQYQLRDQIAQRQQQLAILKTKIQHAHTQHEDTHTAWTEATNQLQQLKSSLYLSENLSDDLLVDAIQTIQKIKDHRQYLVKLNEVHMKLSKTLDDFYTEVDEKIGTVMKRNDKDTLFHDVREWLKSASQDMTRHDHNMEQLNLLEKELKHLKHRLSENQQVIQTLFGAIGALDEESYYKHHERYQRYHERLARFNDLTHFLENQNYGYEKSSKLSEKTTAQLDEEYQKLSEQIDNYNECFLEVQSEVSDLLAQMNHLETDDTLRHLRHQYQLLRNQLNESAEDWAALSYLEALVDEHIKQIKDKRLPQVVNIATDIYNDLTSGQYVQVTYANEQVMVRHQDGQMYHPIELSQSTKELLYIALRLSLIQTLKPYYSLPIIIDDAFVHFDAERRAKMMKYLRGMSDDYQILYFTCSRDSNIPTKQLVTLNKIDK
ncbi:ATP-binding protein [Staphylococcus intermedius]|uniref:ATP-binding protein n=1 Tax=Staphylococcus intermedius TaxID=1285 RepID=UPI000BBB7240|nr:AAA family ATPase [Staphylococcus intermedius]PCF86023.1 DNA repair protein Rad50 [Staphylococcus intermedius]